MNALTDAEVLAIDRARWAVRRLVAETPACLEGDVLVHALMRLLDSSAKHADLGNLAIAAAAVAELVERERGERTMAV